MTQGLNKEYGSIGAAAVAGGALSYLVTGRVFGAVTGGVAAALAVRLMHTQQQLADALQAPEPSAVLQGRVRELERQLYQERDEKMTAQRVTRERTERLEDLQLELAGVFAEKSLKLIEGRAQIESLQEELRKAGIEVSKQKEAIEAYKDELSKKSEDLALARSMIDVNVKNITALKHEIAQLNSEKNELEAALERAGGNFAEGNTTPGRSSADAFRGEFTSSPLPGLGRAAGSLYERYKAQLDKIPGSNHLVWGDVTLPPGTNRGMFRGFTIKMLLNSYGPPSWTPSSTVVRPSESFDPDCHPDKAEVNVTYTDNSISTTNYYNSGVEASYTSDTGDGEGGVVIEEIT